MERRQCQSGLRASTPSSSARGRAGRRRCAANVLKSLWMERPGSPEIAQVAALRASLRIPDFFWDKSGRSGRRVRDATICPSRADEHLGTAVPNKIGDRSRRDDRCTSRTQCAPYAPVQKKSSISRASTMLAMGALPGLPVLSPQKVSDASRCREARKRRTGLAQSPIKCSDPLIACVACDLLCNASIADFLRG